MEVLDEAEVPEFTHSKEADVWYDDIGVKQKELFSDLLTKLSQKVSQMISEEKK